MKKAEPRAPDEKKELSVLLRYLTDQVCSEDADSLLSLVRAAGFAIMKYYRTKDLSIRQKSDASPVTAADIASHLLLKAGLPKIADLPILSEEEIPPATESTDWDRFWLIDPLDGTKEFIRGSADFTINIALIDKNEPVFGILHSPTRNQTYYAARGLGAFSFFSPHSVRQLQVRPPGNTGHRFVSGYFNQGGKTEQFVAGLHLAAHRKLGSAIKFGLIAEGSADIYPRFGPTSLWDTAPGQCLVEEAGGAVLGPDLKPLVYSPPAGFENPPFIACAYVDAAWSPAWRHLAADIPSPPSVS